ncbi:hypothetical protein LPJ77_004303 [Coemansia sp. RSA 2523]|nr:hypothetical protein LPJ58_005963 [Coemansia sp. RSA 1591]KAJ1762471.1 hypothetical protein LPJ69_002766 [Coemansia sp. RSA 1752]KAJ1774484.1 hypothetical protein LPJ62_007085 [Coemansia sp. RSA 2167]KAJ1774888.1 hypothetical protein LPJ54_004023 [Coemansia sp. RSA 1824]KAJ1805296.1 hypothetical protein LPJ77_004303 [Coemansia sp. RSA 2523]KAJ2150308.1 hypothetical protein J3F82_004061 [Coemansia sp. RSA 637]KAJ2165930.1 hypothetical protein GGH15_003067 [Coemansia sp. RSA 562]KAJ2180354.
MLRCLTISTLRTNIAQRSSVRLYSSDKGTLGTPPAPFASNEGSEGKPKAKGVSSRSSLQSLIDNLADNASKSTRASPTVRTNRFSGLMGQGSGSEMMKDDYMNFSRTGRFGGESNSRFGEDQDPMNKLILHVHATSNNTILSLTDANGRVIVNSSGGLVGFKKAQRAGFEAAYQATASVANTVKERDIFVKNVEIRLRGFGAGRDAAFKAVGSLTNWNICAITDVTPIPFNGCRPKKARRL